MIGLGDGIDSEGENQIMEDVRTELLQISDVQSVQIKRRIFFF